MNALKILVLFVILVFIAIPVITGITSTTQDHTTKSKYYYDDDDATIRIEQSSARRVYVDDNRITDGHNHIVISQHITIAHNSHQNSDRYCIFDFRGTAPIVTPLPYICTISISGQHITIYDSETTYLDTDTTDKIYHISYKYKYNMIGGSSNFLANFGSPLIGFNLLGWNALDGILYAVGEAGGEASVSGPGAQSATIDQTYNDDGTISVTGFYATVLGATEKFAIILKPASYSTDERIEGSVYDIIRILPLLIGIMIVGVAAYHSRVAD